MAGELSAGSVVGSYRIESLVGRGGMGVVYRAQHTRLKRLAALKVLAPEWANDPDFRERFERESELAAHVDHPNIIPVYDAGEAEGLLYIAMRFVDGTDLRQLLDREGPLTPSRALDLLEKVAVALDAAHRRGLVHRDVKPGNVMIEHPGDTESERVFLTDFGLVKRAGAPASVTRTGYFVGTVEYAAPEQFRGEELDGRADQYALGCVLYQCLTGRAPFARDDDAATMFAHLSEPPPRLGESTGAPASLDPVLARAMAKSRDDRFPTCTAFMQDARKALAEAAARTTEPFTAHTAIAPPPTPPARAAAPAPASSTPPAKPSVPPSFVQPPRPKPARPTKPPKAPKQARPHKERPPKRRRRALLAAGIVIVLVAAAAGAIALSGGHKNKANPPPTTTTPPSSPATSSPPPPAGFAASTTLDSLTPVSVSDGTQLTPGSGTVSGFTFDHSLVFSYDSNSSFSAVYRLPDRYRSFHSLVGLSDTSGFQSVTFELFVGTRRVGQPVDVGPGLPQPIDADLNGARRLTLQFTPHDCTEFNCTSEVIWASPVLIGTGSPPSPPVPPSKPSTTLDSPELQLVPLGDTEPPTTGRFPIGGKSFPHSLDYSLGSCDLSPQTSWNLDGSYTTLTATLGMSSDSTCSGLFSVFLDHSRAAPPFVVAPGHTLNLHLPLKDPRTGSPAGLLVIEVDAGNCTAFSCTADAIMGTATAQGTISE